MLESISKGIERAIDKEGEVSALLILPLVIVVIYEVIMRYVFNAPTIWGFELTTFLYGVHYMLGLGYTELYGGHVRVDILTSRLSEKTQAVLAIVTTLVIFLPVMTLMTIWSFKYAITSCVGLECNPTSWAPPIYPIKLLMAASFFLLWLQGVAGLLKNIEKVRRS